MLKELITQASKNPMDMLDYSYSPYQPVKGPGAIWTEAEEIFIMSDADIEDMQIFTNGRSIGAIKSRQNKLC